MEELTKLKTAGNALFAQEKYTEAMESYYTALFNLLQDKTDGLPEPSSIKSIDHLTILSKAQLSAEEKAMATVLYSNMAACLLNSDKLEECIKLCDVALNLDSEAIKALYRKSLALSKQKDHSGCLKHLNLLLKKDPNNQKAKKLYMEETKTLQSKSSIINQTKDMIDKLKENASKDEVEKYLRFIYSHLLDDKVYARDVAKIQDLASLLWKWSQQTKYALLVLKALLDTAFPLLSEMLPLEDIETKVKDPSNSDENIILWDIYFIYYQNKRVSLDEMLSAVAASLKGRNKYVIKILIKVLNKGEKEESLRFINDFDGFSILLGLLEQKKTDASLRITTEMEEQMTKDFRTSIQTVAIVLGILLPSLKEDEKIKESALQITLPSLRSRDIFEQMKGCATLLAILIANLELGAALVLETDEKIIDILLELSKSAPAKTQGLICEIFAYLANNENGRNALKADERCKVMLNLLVHSDTINVRTNAAVTLAKLNATKFDKESDQGMVVLASVAKLLKEGTTEEEKAKGIETISYVITDRDVKIMLCETSEGLRLLDTLVDLATKEKSVATSPYAFGLAYIFENLTMSEDDKRREKLREMEVTQKQWEEFQKLTKTQTEGHKPDPQENVNRRIRALMDHNGAAALRALVLNGGSDRVRQSISRSYANCAVVQEARGQMFSQGAARALIDLTLDKEKAEIETKKSRNEEKAQRERLSATKKQAAHALAKMFITTNPNVIGFNVVLDSLKSLVDNLRACSDEDLIVFETCMALTNLSTMSRDAKRRIISLGAIKQLEYASYNEDLLVRRSACECLCNLVPEKEMIEWFTSGNHMKLWLMFASAYEEDLKTSEACLGALAGVCSYPEIAKVIEAEEKGLPTLVVLLMSEEQSLIHRVTVCLLCLVEALEEGKAKLKAVLIENAIAKAEEVPLVEEVLECLVALKEALDIA